MFFFFWFSGGAPLTREQRIVRFKILGWTVGVVALVLLLAAAISSLMPKPVPVVQPNVPVYVPFPVAPQVVPQAQLDATREKILTGSDQMAKDVEKQAPGSLGAMQARSLADFIAAHCGKPGGCLKK
ncbi:hypothetical protein SAMN05216466_106171 [Paraburkholderia phenazinium]|uniref:Uncharacterized protein n=1 Tax=Paraburkholderia phenazinium TaxID=60549 RepID=A0A1G7YHQ5_9BURK|nr:hypothetical protein [Paraburkholderia phenazinium]SDG95410.1 hypothetical protein SAMN05216466_106171 [Paraburkholderia phenazinium]